MASDRDAFDYEGLERIHRELARLLGSVAPQEAAEMHVEGFTFPDHDSHQAYWLRDDGSVGHFGFDQPDAIDRVGLLMREMRGLEPYAAEPWTHFHIKLTHEGQLTIDFAYIPEEQSMSGVYMRPVGGLSEAEAKAKFVPREDWAIRAELHRGEITKAQFDQGIRSIEQRFDADRARLR